MSRRHTVHSFDDIEQQTNALANAIFPDGWKRYPEPVNYQSPSHITEKRHPTSSGSRLSVVRASIEKPPYLKDEYISGLWGTVLLPFFNYRASRKFMAKEEITYDDTLDRLEEYVLSVQRDEFTMNFRNEVSYKRGGRTSSLFLHPRKRDGDEYTRRQQAIHAKIGLPDGSLDGKIHIATIPSSMNLDPIIKQIEDTGPHTISFGPLEVIAGSISSFIRKSE